MGSMVTEGAKDDSCIRRGRERQSRGQEERKM